MKKFLAIIMVFALAAAVFPMAVSADQINLENLNIQITVDRAAVPPVIDGRIDEHSYKMIEAARGDFSYNDNSDGSFLGFLQDAGNVQAYISYDADNFYVLLSGSALYYYCEIDDPSSIWRQSGIQISVATGDAFGDARLELGLARNSISGNYMSNLWANGPDGPNNFDIVFGQNAAILREGDRINYEIAIPWTMFLPAVPSAGDTFGFNYVYYFFPESEFNRMIVEYSAGCAYGKDAEEFAKVTLTANVLAEPEAAATDATPAPVAVDPAPAVLAPDPRAYIPVNQTARPTSATVLIDGEEAAFDAYNIEGNNYFKLRDLAFVLSGTEKQFNVGWEIDEKGTGLVTLTSGESYDIVGGEMEASATEGNRTAAPGTSGIYLDGEWTAFTAYLIGGNNYFKLRDIMEALDVYVGWDGASNTITLDTGMGYEQ